MVAYRRAANKASHIASFCVETEDFRKIRFTYMDGGKSLQIFNSVWYPRFDTDAPILGIELLLFGGHKMLAVVGLKENISPCPKKKNINNDSFLNRVRSRRGIPR